MEPDSSNTVVGATGRVLLLAPDSDVVSTTALALACDRSAVCRTESVDEFLQLLSGAPVELALVDLSLIVDRRAETVRRLEDCPPALGSIWLAPATWWAADGADDSIPGPIVTCGTPWTEVALRSACEQIRERRRLAEENHRLKRRLAQRRSGDIIGHGAAMKELRRQVTEAAAHDRSVRVLGEPGAGKGLVAQTIHDGSSRAYRPLIRVSCDTLASTNLERELFGWSSGADVAAPTGQPGRFELARGGVLLLHHVDQIAFPLQIKLLETLRNRWFEKLGSRERLSLDVRVISTSCEDLAGLAAKGAFHEGLLEFLGETQITVPPLREHPEDIAPLTERILHQVAVRDGEPVRRIPLETLQLLCGYAWPGNVRELQCLIERACALETGSRLTTELIRPWLASAAPSSQADFAAMSLQEMERKLIESTFERCGGNRERTAQALKIGLRTLSGKLREYGYPPRGGPGSNRKGYDTRAA